MSGNSESEIVSGWKQVAAFLRVSTRTARRWRELYALPVGKIGQGRVISSRRALGAWVMRFLREE